MSKDKRKKTKGKHRDNDKQQARSPESEIARAEKRLAKALNAVEEAREQLRVRELELRDLLQKHGRMPEHVEPSSHEALEVDGGDSRTDEAERHEAADGSAASVSADQPPPTAPLLDQQQVVTTPPTGDPGEDHG